MRTEDGHIIHKCLGGDSAAFGFLVDKYKASIYAFAYSRLNNFNDAEDVTQEVFIRAYQKLRTLKRLDSFLAWLYSITSNECKMHIRARSTQPHHESLEDVAPDTLEIISLDSYREKLARESVDDSLQEALDALPETYRQVLILYYLGGMSNKEIARFLGTSSDNIRQRLTRARSQMKEEMVAMMSADYAEQRLQASFTFRIVEAVKRIKIEPIPRATGVPWGLSLATGIIFTILSLSPYLSILNPTIPPMSSTFPAEMKSLKIGEIPVDILSDPEISIIASKQDDGNGGEPGLPDLQNAALMAALDEGDTWTAKTPMPTARALLSTSVVDGKIYAIGGRQTNGANASSAVEQYDPVTDTWTKKASLPTARQWLSTSAVNGKIYAIGGTARTFQPALSTVEEYDPTTDTWTEKAPMPTARFTLSTSVVDGKIYAIGGAFRPPERVTSDVEAYDPATDIWTKKAPMPTARVFIATSVVNGKIYAIGGATAAGGTVLSTVEEYDPVTDTWTTKAPMPTRRMVFLSASVMDGIIYVIGGGNFNTVLSTVEAYDPATDTWTKKTSMPGARGILATSAVNGKIYAVGGTLGGALNGVSTVEEYDTGFVTPKKTSSIEPKGKLVTTWAEIRSY